VIGTIAAVTQPRNMVLTLCARFLRASSRSRRRVFIIHMGYRADAYMYREMLLTFQINQRRGHGAQLLELVQAHRCLGATA